MVLTGFLLPRPYKLYTILRARYRPAPIDRARVERVLAALDGGQLNGCRQPAIGPGRSTNLILETSGGLKVLKQYRPDMSPGGIAYEHSVLKHLAHHNFPSPRLIPNREGETCLEVDGRYYALFEFIPGFRYSDYFFPSRKIRSFLTEAGKVLARYHQLVDGLVPAGRKLDGFTPDGSRRWRDQSWYLDLFAASEESFKARGTGSESSRFFLDNLTRLKECYIDLNRGLAQSLSSLPKLVIHGDYGPYNLLFNEGALVAVLDFECTHLDLRAIEVITSLVRFASPDARFDYDKARIFFRAYVSQCPLSRGEIERMPDLFRLEKIRVLACLLEEYFSLADSLKLRYARRLMDRIDWMARNGEELVQVLLECAEIRG